VLVDSDLTAAWQLVEYADAKKRVVAQKSARRSLKQRGQLFENPVPLVGAALDDADPQLGTGDWSSRPWNDSESELLDALTQTQKLVPIEKLNHHAAVSLERGLVLFVQKRRSHNQ
jgi:hypothetical protein